MQLEEYVVENILPKHTFGRKTFPTLERVWVHLILNLYDHVPRRHKDDKLDRLPNMYWNACNLNQKCIFIFNLLQLCNLYCVLESRSFNHTPCNRSIEIFQLLNSIKFTCFIFPFWFIYYKCSVYWYLNTCIPNITFFSCGRYWGSVNIICPIMAETSFNPALLVKIPITFHAHFILTWYLQ